MVMTVPIFCCAIFQKSKSRTMGDWSEREVMYVAYAGENSTIIQFEQQLVLIQSVSQSVSQHRQVKRQLLSNLNSFWVSWY